MLTAERLDAGASVELGEKRRTKPSRHDVSLDWDGMDDSIECADRGDVGVTSGYRGSGCGVEGPTKESESTTERSEEGVGI